MVISRVGNCAGRWLLRGEDLAHGGGKSPARDGTRTAPETTTAWALPASSARTTATTWSRVNLPGPIKRLDHPLCCIDLDLKGTAAIAYGSCPWQ